ncbi:uncharacterized protein TEOVI_000410500 [Trypanosoma equiperdum]|uniref:Uncharacterized protein n=4 Tax=Trypanozoon TaxID=39700 RepID=Q38BU8_TRYB2|nr:hypothetical protein, conserved [Trypanosoma brucei gambiense DAL972]XP_822550.1 hypothetical protein, conserved [Trypanosoma brucei brucei TREU927]RHW69039.1 hypothetical protein DPX39_100036200 [Trypanosoma brucei equiperdum]SCU72528.1 hypothetical protein, conserved [Trypanosoma equiperdum]EAN77722.1 hypothetical protein, conserved [Trypanosoma brucei brucei TREU927]CBH15286.1 hypothetical protein, conserved [Trypanosoma brucei gambiense DAL972]|eukprot:XP_011777551.1 hypothetical protein, conserved [Trypanosoma brucei gambiense DAL972]
MLPLRVLPFIAAGGYASQLRFYSEGKPTEGHRKINLDDDERWIEAEFDEKLRSPEERYALERQRETMKGLIKKIRNEHKQHMHESVRERDAQIDNLKEQIQTMEKKLQQLTNEKQ